jgi:hypothetical protein
MYTRFDPFWFIRDSRSAVTILVRSNFPLYGSKGVISGGENFGDTAGAAEDEDEGLSEEAAGAGEEDEEDSLELLEPELFEGVPVVAATN